MCCAIRRRQPSPPELQHRPALRALLTALGFVWASPTTALGLIAALVCYAAGRMMRSGARFRIGNQALQLLDSPLNFRGRAFTLGHVQVYGRDWGPDACAPSYTGAVVNIGLHEQGHTAQARWLGPLFLPMWLAGRLMGGDSAANPLEGGADRYALGLCRHGF